LKLSGHVEGYIKLKKMFYVLTTTTSSYSNNSATAIATTIAKANSINVELLETVDREVGLNQNTLRVCRLSERLTSNIIETGENINLKLSGHKERMLN
jgi:hypothetical protein